MSNKTADGGQQDAGRLPPEYTVDVVDVATEKMLSILRQTEGGNNELSMESGVPQMLLHLIDDFIVKTTEAAALYASHRGAAHIEREDILLALEVDQSMQLPGVRRGE